MFAQDRLYLTADKDRLVPEGHEDAATLYCSPGDEIPDSAADKFGLVDGALPEPGAPKKAKRGGSTKEAQAGADKGTDGAGEGGTPPAAGAE